MEQDQLVTFEIIGSIGILTLDAPPGNYLPVPAFIPPELFSEWTADETLKGLIIHGSGRNFSAGADLAAMLNPAIRPELSKPLLRQGHQLLSSIEDLDMPVIAAINGVCFGGGLEIALACHIRIASEKSLFAFPEINRNLIPGLGGTFRLPALTTRAHAITTILGGDIINAHDAYSMGIVDQVTPSDSFKFALELMEKITRDKPVKVIRYAMRALNNAGKINPEKAALIESEMFCELASDEVARRKITGEHL